MLRNCSHHTETKGWVWGLNRKSTESILEPIPSLVPGGGKGEQDLEWELGVDRCRGRGEGRNAKLQVLEVSRKVVCGHPYCLLWASLALL